MMMMIRRERGGGTGKRVSRVGEAGAREGQQRRAVEECHNHGVEDDAHACPLREVEGGTGGGAKNMGGDAI